MGPLRPSPQRERALEGSRPKKGCEGRKHPRPHLLRPRLQGRRLLAAVAGAEGAAGGSLLCPVSSVPSLPCPRRRGAGPVLWCGCRRCTPRAARALAPSEPTHGKLSPLATSRRTDPLPPRVMRPRGAGRDYFPLPSPSAAPRDGRRGGGPGRAGEGCSAAPRAPGVSRIRAQGRREGTAALAGIDLRIPPSGLA